MTVTLHTPLAYRLHGHPVCLACFDDDYLLDDDGTARGWPARGDVPGVQPIHAGDPDAAGPCAGCRRLLLAPPVPDPNAPDDGAPFRPDTGPVRLALAALRLRDAAAALRRCLAHGDLASDPRRAAFRDLAACLDAASLDAALGLLVHAAPCTASPAPHRYGGTPPASPERSTPR